MNAAVHQLNFTTTEGFHAPRVVGPFSHQLSEVSAQGWAHFSRCLALEETHDDLQAGKEP